MSTDVYRSVRSRPRPTRGVLYVRNLPGQVKSLFKGTCARRGDDMTRVIAALMELYVRDPKVVKVPKRRK